MTIRNGLAHFVLAACFSLSGYRGCLAQDLPTQDQPEGGEINGTRNGGEADGNPDQQGFGRGRWGQGNGAPQAGTVPGNGPGSNPGPNPGPNPGWGLRRMQEGSGPGQNGPGPGGFNDPERAARRQRMMARFDTNHDGMLDDKEKAQMRAFMQQRRAEREARGGGQFPGLGGGQRPSGGFGRPQGGQDGGPNARFGAPQGGFNSPRAGFGGPQGGPNGGQSGSQENQDQ